MIQENTEPVWSVDRHPILLLQTLHRLDVRVNRGAEGKSGKVFVGNLSEENAMDLAGKVVSEAFVWGVRLSFPIYRVSKS